MKLRVVIFLLLAVLALTVLVVVQQRIDRERTALEQQEALLYLSSGKLVKRLSLGYDGLLACLYWTRAVQHFGSESLGLQRYNLLYDLLDITTTLDPDLHLAYRYGAVFLSAIPPQGPGRPDQAIQLLEKGIQHKDRWEYWLDMGFVYYLKLEDYERAAEAFEHGGKLPGASVSMRMMGPKIRSEGSSRQMAMFIWQQLYESTDDPAVRAAARLHLNGLRADAEIEALEKLVAQYREQAARDPAAWRDLIQAGLLPGIPADPSGHPYVLVQGGRVLIHRDSEIPITVTTSKERAE